MSDPVDDQELLKSLPQKALRKIRALCQGNGADPDSVQIKSAQGRIVTCEALTHLEIHPDFKDESKKGAYQIGEFFEDGASMERAMDEYLSGIIKHSDSRRAMVSVIKKAPGYGFGSHAEYFDMDSFNKDYSFQQTCNHCGGQAMTVCSYCNGQAKERCSKCHGQTMIHCPHCQSSGRVRNAQGQDEPCRQCAGRGQISCPVCHRTGTVSCRGCRGAGQLKCKGCDGAGIFTHIRHVIVKMKTLFEIDRTELPHPAVKAIEDAGPRMVDRGHIKLAQVEQVTREDGGLVVQYQAHFPYGDLEISINGKPMKTHLFGYKGKLLKLPPFLESMTEKNMHLLETAASQAQGALQNIRKAAASRLIAQALFFAVTLPRKHAMKALKKKFPIGVSNQHIQKLIRTSNKALLNTTQKARFTGYLVMTILLVALFMAYFIVLRPIIVPLISADIITLIADLCVMGVGSYIGYAVLSKMLQRPLQQVLHMIAHQKESQRFKPKTQVGYGICLAITAGIFISSVLVGSYIDLFSAPFWLPIDRFL